MNNYCLFSVRSLLAGLMGALTITVMSAGAQDDPETALRRADRLAILRDQMVADYTNWSEDYARKRTTYAKKQKENTDLFLKMVHAKGRPAMSKAILKGAVQLRFVCMSGLKRPGYAGRSTNTVLKLSTGQLVDGPDIGAMMAADAGKSESFMEVLAAKVGESGDIALLENRVLIPSGRYANLGSFNIQYFADEDLAGRIQKQDPTCMAKRGDTILIETADKKYALIQVLGKYQEEALLCIAYQPNGSAVFHFGATAKPKELDYTNPGVDPEGLAGAMFVTARENFYWKEYSAVARSLLDIAEEKIQGADIGQTEKARQLIVQLGIEESIQSGSTNDTPHAGTP